MTRGFALQYKIRKTTIGNETGDNFSITIPRIIAKQFTDCYFKLSVSGCSLLFISGCKVNSDEEVIKRELERRNSIVGGVPVVFK